MAFNNAFSYTWPVLFWWITTFISYLYWRKTISTKLPEYCHYSFLKNGRNVLYYNKYWHLVSAHTRHRVIYISWRLYPGRMNGVSFVVQNFSQRHLSFTQRLPLPIPEHTTYTSLSLHQGPRLLLFLHFGLGEKWRFDNAAGRIDFIIYSVMYVNRRKKYKKKRDHTIVLCSGGWTSIYLFCFFFYPSAVFSPSERSFLYECVRFLCLTPFPWHYYSDTHFLHSPLAHTHTHKYTLFYISRFFFRRNVIFLFFFFTVSRFVILFYVVYLHRSHNDCTPTQQRVDERCLWTELINFGIDFFFIHFIFLRTPSCEMTK